MTQCPNCAHEQLRDVAENRQIAYGGDDAVLLLVHVPLKQCTHCSVVFSYDASDQAIQSAAARYRRVLTRMN